MKKQKKNSSFLLETTNFNSIYRYILRHKDTYIYGERSSRFSNYI